MTTSSPSQSHPVAYLTITVEQAGQRIDNFLLAQLKGIPKSHVYRILRTGEVRVNKGRIKPPYRLQVNDVIRLPPMLSPSSSPPEASFFHQQLLANAILYEDSHLLIINKPAGMAVHGGIGIGGGVIENLRELYPQAPHLELVHRLDRDTSGCLMISKRNSMLRRLHELFRQGQIHKQYLALVQGCWNPKVTHCDAPLQKNILRSGERMVRVHTDGKPARSQFSIEQQLPTTTLLRIQPKTGRTHQLRVHTAYMGHPIAGDSKYGNDEFNQQMQQVKLNRLFLHAEQLDIQIPEIDFNLLVKAPLPACLKQVLHRLDIGHVKTI
jgi:23S rRNA pseudouridine955/2504/2580 synthase